MQRSESAGEALNVGSGRSYAIAEVGRRLARVLEREDLEPHLTGQYRVGDIRHCFADVSKLERDFGLRPRRGFEEGMGELIEWVAAARRPVDRAQASLGELQRSRLVV